MIQTENTSSEANVDEAKSATPKPEEEKVENPPKVENSSVESPAQETSTISDPEEKLKKMIESMESALSQAGNPDFKTFWEARKECFELFKLDISPPVKSLLWTKYRELTKEAKRLKEHFEEQTAFAVEQIEIAIQALEKEIEQSGAQKENIPSPALPKGLKALKDNEIKYLDWQKELNFLNVQASRINALRKELIRTEMRIRFKNKFFQRLSAAGDKVFPRRKELIKQVSETFVNDINAFVTKQFKSANLEKNLHFYRDEIKFLQQAAKVLTLNTHAFTQSRLLLSECWDKLKTIEKDRKKEHTQQRQASKECADAVREKIKVFSEAVAGNQATSEIQKQFDEITSFMRTQELTREDVRALKYELNEAYKPLKEKLKAEEQKRREAKQEKEEARQRGLQELEEKIKAFDPSNDAEALTDFEAEIDAFALTENEKFQYESLLGPVKDAIAENEEAELINAAPTEKKEAIKALKKVLNRKLERRTVIREQMEQCRKAGGSSGLDFERSLYFNEQLKKEKARVEEINESIAHLEAQIAKLKKG